MTRAAWLLVGLAGCLFRDPGPPHFFRPGSATLDAASADVVDAPRTGGIAVRLRAVRSVPFLRERIVWRVSEVEYGLYEQRRWIDLPAHYVDRALQARLRATPGLRLSDDPRAAVLHVDVLAFDEMLAPVHAATVALAAALEAPARGLVLERTFVSEVGIEDREPASMAKAMGQALDEAVGQVADAVRVSLLTR